jgi:hypothetical protein
MSFWPHLVSVAPVSHAFCSFSCCGSHLSCVLTPDQGCFQILPALYAHQQLIAHFVGLAGIAGGSYYQIEEQPLLGQGGLLLA